MIVFNIATIERRKKMFMEVLAMLVNQTIKCDHINVALGYQQMDNEILKYLGDNFKSFHIKWGAKIFTSEYKLYAVENNLQPDCIFSTFDDDIIYPPDYMQRSIMGLEKYNREAVVGFHGIKFSKFPVKNYKLEKTMFQYFKNVAEDTDVHVIGTGCMTFHLKTLLDKGLKFSEINKKLNCLDGAFGRFCRDNQIKMVVLQHEESWMKIYPNSQDSNALWRKSWAERYKTKLSFLEK